MTVKYEDLNLSSEEGSRQLYKRLVQAAERVCPQKSDTPLALRTNRDSNKCIVDAVERAVQQIKSPRFAEVAAAAAAVRKQPVQLAGRPLSGHCPRRTGIDVIRDICEFDRIAAIGGHRGECLRHGSDTPLSSAG